MTARTRTVEPSDHDRLRRIQQATLEEPSPDLLAAAVDGPLLGLARIEDERLVGYVIAVVGDDRAYLPELAVEHDAQRAGHGSALLAAVCRRLRSRGVTEVRVTARADDDRARRFYEASEFEVVETVPEYYADGADGVVYRRAC